MVKAYLKYKFN